MSKLEKKKKVKQTKTTTVPSDKTRGIGFQSKWANCIHSLYSTYDIFCSGGFNYNVIFYVQQRGAKTTVHIKIKSTLFEMCARSCSFGMWATQDDSHMHICSHMLIPLHIYVSEHILSVRFALFIFVCSVIIIFPYNFALFCWSGLLCSHDGTGKNRSLKISIVNIELKINEQKKKNTK